MPYCPQCRCEYREGFTECSDCHVTLVDELPELPKTPEPPKPKIQKTLNDENVEILFTTTTSPESADLIIGLLRDNDIPYYIQTINPLSYTFGNKSFPRNIFVSKNDVERAKELVECYLSPQEIQEEDIEQVYQDENIDQDNQNENIEQVYQDDYDDYPNNYKTGRDIYRTILKICAGIFIVPIALMVIIRFFIAIFNLIGALSS